MGDSIIGSFDFGGVSSADFNMFVFGDKIFKSSIREYDSYEVPGMNGSLHVDNKRYGNVNVPYTVYIKRDFDENYTRFRNEILTKVGYQKFRDSFHPDEYRLARLSSELSPKVGLYNLWGKFDIDFDCKPEHWLISGLEEQEFTTNGVITNPELTEAKPLIRVYGSGTVNIGGYAFSVASHGYDYIDIDSEIMDAFNGVTNLNNRVTLQNDLFPVLIAGDNNITFSGNISKVIITPRWWRL